MHGPESSRAWLGSTWATEEAPHWCNERVPAPMQRRRPRIGAAKEATYRCDKGAPIGATKEATYRCGCRWMRTRRKARSASREATVEPSHARLAAQDGLCTGEVFDARTGEQPSMARLYLVRRKSPRAGATQESPRRCNERVPAQVQRKSPRTGATKEAPPRCNGGGPNDATKKAPQCGAFLYFDAAPISASSNRRTRRWTWCSSSCRAGIPLRPFHPSDAAACAGSRSSAAVPVRSAGLRDGYPSG